MGQQLKQPFLFKVILEKEHFICTLHIIKPFLGWRERFSVQAGTNLYRSSHYIVYQVKNPKSLFAAFCPCEDRLILQLKALENLYTFPFEKNKLIR